jgi:hypothetical protein
VADIMSARHRARFQDALASSRVFLHFCFGPACWREHRPGPNQAARRPPRGLGLDVINDLVLSPAFLAERYHALESRGSRPALAFANGRRAPPYGNAITPAQRYPSARWGAEQQKLRLWGDGYRRAQEGYKRHRWRPLLPLDHLRASRAAREPPIGWAAIRQDEPSESRW